MRIDLAGERGGEDKNDMLNVILCGFWVFFLLNDQSCLIVG